MSRERRNTPSVKDWKRPESYYDKEPGRWLMPELTPTQLQRMGIENLDAEMERLERLKEDERA